MTNKIDNVVLSPHFDDGIFSLYSILANDKLSRSLITIFSGLPENKKNSLWDFLCTGKSSVKTMKIRIQENENVSNLLGFKTLNLGFLDKQYKKSNDPADIKNKILQYIDKSDSVIYAPIAMSSLYRHADHILIRNIAIDLFSEGFRVIFYADIPYMDTSKIITNKIFESLKEKTGNDFTSETITLSRSSIKNKFNTMRLYKSQYMMTNLTSLGRLSNTHYFSKEVLFKPTAYN